MGYESKIFIVSKGSYVEEGLRYSQLIAMMDMSKMKTDFYDLFKEKTDCFFYELDGNTKIIEDRYGDPLRECRLESIENYVANLIEKGEDYRRLWPLLSLVRSFKSPQWKNDDLVALHYGY